MARRKKCRRICEYPSYFEFGPKDSGSKETVVLNMDEYSTIYFMDYKGLNQTECADCMDVARTTVTDIYMEARKKIADAMVNGKKLVISGGNYRVSNKEERKYYKEQYGIETNRIHGDEQIHEKKKSVLRVFVNLNPETGTVFPHFGETQEFKVFDIENKKIIKSEILKTGGILRGAVVGFLEEAGADVVICDHVGECVRRNLEKAEIKIYPGVTGNVDEVIREYILGTLEIDESACLLQKNKNCKF